MKFRTAYNYEPEKNRAEKNELPSLTVPDMSYTVREILQKFVNNVPLAISRQNGTYDEDIDLDNFDPTRIEGFDMVEAQALYQDVTSRINELQEVQAAAKAKAAERSSEPSSDGGDSTADTSPAT